MHAHGSFGGMIGELRQAPPHNLEAEQVVLGSVLLGKASPDVLPEPEFFYRDAHKEIARSIKELVSSGKKADLITVTGHLKDRNKLDQVGGAAYIASLTDVIFFNPEHIEIITRKAVLREVISSFSDVVVKAYNDQYDVVSILAEVQRKTNKVLSMSGTRAYEKLEANFDELMNHFSARETHLKCLNKAIGGLFGGDVIVIGGRTSMGKTSLVMGFLRQISVIDNQPSVYFGPEVTEQKIYGRLLSSMCKVDFRTLRRGNVTKTQRENLRNAHKEINSAPINIFARDGKINVMDIATQTRSLASKLDEEIGFVAVENLQQVTWPEKTKSRKEEIDLVYGCLKSLAMELNIPVVVSSQVVREVEDREDKRPLPSDLSNSGDIESLADTIIMLYRDEYYYPEKVKKSKDGSVDAEMAIYKTGPPTVLMAKFNSSFLLWEDK